MKQFMLVEQDIGWLLTYKDNLACLTQLLEADTQFLRRSFDRVEDCGDAFTLFHHKIQHPQLPLDFSVQMEDLALEDVYDDWFDHGDFFFVPEVLSCEESPVSKYRPERLMQKEE